MFKKYLIFLILFTFSFGEDNKLYNISLGLFNERFGYDIINFSYIFYSKNNNEFFVSSGSAFPFVWSAGLGWKRFFNNIKNHKILPLVCISVFKRWGNKLAVTNGSSVREDNCISFASGVSFYTVNLNKYTNLYFQLGGFALADFRNKIELFPFLNMEFRF